jgi:hypothetical protein
MSASSVLAINAGSSSVKCSLFALAKEPSPLSGKDWVAPSGIPRLLDWLAEQASRRHSRRWVIGSCIDQPLGFTLVVDLSEAPGGPPSSG